MSLEYVIEYLCANAFWIYIIRRYMQKLFFDAYVAEQVKIITVYVLFYLANSLGSLVLNHPVCNVVTSLIGIYVITTLYKAHFSKRILAVFMVYIISMLCDIFVATLIGSYSIGMRMSIINNIVSYLVIFCVELILEKFVQFRMGYKVAKKDLFVILGIPAGSIAIIIVLVINKVNMPVVVTLISMVLLGINVLVMYMYETLLRDYEKNYQTKVLERELEGYREQLEIIELSQRKVEQFRHDMKHHLLAISKMAELGHLEKIQTYVGEMIESTINYRENVVTGNSDIDSILNYLIQRAQDKGIKVSTDIKISEKMSISLYDFNIVLGNLLENAIDAAEFSEEKYIRIGLELNRNIIYIDVINSYTGRIIKRGDVLLTTKDDSEGHGLGLQNTVMVLEKYHGDLSIDYNDKIFCVNAMMYLE